FLHQIRECGMLVHREHLLGLFVLLLTFYRKGALFSIPFGFYWIINTPVSSIPNGIVLLIRCDEQQWPAVEHIDATKKFNISLTEKWFAHFRLSKASVWLASVTP
ncbi:hypothetical protein ABEO87_13325, partial [Geobacillus stearothermophilus]